MDDLTLGDGSHPLESQSAFGQVEEDNWAEIGIVKQFTALSRVRPAVSLPQRLLGDAWRRGHAFIHGAGIHHDHRGQLHLLSPARSAVDLAAVASLRGTHLLRSVAGLQIRGTET